MKRDEWTGNLQAVEVYDPRDGPTGQWREVAQLPLPLGHLTPSIVSYKCQILVLCGTTSDKTHPNLLLRFNPTEGVNGTWHDVLQVFYFLSFFFFPVRKKMR